MKQTFLYLISVNLICYVAALRVLSVVPTATKSHYAVQKSLIYELLNRGHEVVSISPYEEKIVSKNFTWIDLEVKNVMHAVPHMQNTIFNRNSFFMGQRHVWQLLEEYTRVIVKKPKLKQFIENDTSHFDVILIEEFLQPIFTVFSYKYKAPFIFVSSFGSAHFISNYMGNSLELAYAPHEFKDVFGDMSLFQRINNLICTIYDLIGRQIYVVQVQNEMVKDVFKGLENVPHLADLERSAAMLFSNSHFSMNVIRPLLPNMIEVGGIHIEDVKPLNKELQNILDEAPHGVIYFSFGSVLELSRLPEDVLLNVLHTLGRLKQRVLLKWNGEKKLPVKYENIYTMPWIPQNDVLAHPNIKLFVTHGGLLSAMEAVYHGVPTICVPFFGDQPLNCQRSVQLKYGLKVDKTAIGTEQFGIAIEKILTDANFSSNVKTLSRRFTDRQNSAIDTAMYWIEYCGRHKDMEFLSSARRKLYWFQYYFIDVLVCFFATFLVVLTILKYVVSLFRRKNKVKMN